MRLSKSTFIAWQNCPHNAWYRVNDRALFETYVDPSTKVLLAIGNEIDELARQVFPNGLTLGRGQFQETRAAIERRVPVIFQGEFRTNDHVVLSDVLVWNATDAAYDILEVKSSTTASDGRDEEYAYDLAFQEYVLKACAVPVGNTYLMRLNSDYVRKGAIDIQALFARTDFGDAVSEIRSDLPAIIRQASAWINLKSPPEGPCGCVRLSRGNHCEMFRHINPEVPDYSVHDIARIHKSKLDDLIGAGLLDIRDVPEGFQLSDKQKIQVRIAKSGKPEIDAAAIATFMDAIALPAAFLDFETHNAAVPRFDGYRPYQQIPFQFSLHIINNWDAEPEHQEFLHMDVTEPDHRFIDALQRVLPKFGAVIVWNKGFERARLQEVAVRHPAYAAFVQDVADRLVDLADVFSNQWYVHPAFRGSYSIKKVLPVLIDDPKLSYKRLGIQDGGQAQAEWNKIVTGTYSAATAQSVAHALLAYCELDTMAMVAIGKPLYDIAHRYSSTGRRTD